MMAFLKKKTLFLVMVVAVVTVGSLLMAQQFWNGARKPETRKVHNFKKLSDTLVFNNLKSQTSFQSSLTIPHQKRIDHSYIDTGKPSITDEMTDIFNQKISKITSEAVELEKVCHTDDVIANSCDDKCLQMKFPKELRERIAQLVEPSELRLTTQNEKILNDMARNVKGGFQFMILSGASSNHFLEAQALIRNLHENIYPHFKNFTFVLYNLGLTTEERSQMSEFCKCQVVDFPFYKFPRFVSKRLCYAWKPLIVRAHIDQAKIVMWLDASIRFDSDPEYFSRLLRLTKRRTMQIAFSRAISPFRTDKSMYHFFGDEPCMYLNMGQVQSGIDLFSSEHFVKRVVLEPWAACATFQRCQCPMKEPNKTCSKSKEMEEAWRNNQGPITYGLCHRYDQSSLSIVLHKLYQNFFRWVTFDVKKYLQIKRKDTHSYFETLR